MNAFVLHLASATQSEEIAGVISFIGRDDSGSFGIEAGHVRMMTMLTFGLARFRTDGGDWEYLALPGGLAYFTHGELHISTRRYVRGQDLELIGTALREELRAEEESLLELKRSVSRLEEEMFKRLWKMGRGMEA